MNGAFVENAGGMNATPGGHDQVVRESPREVMSPSISSAEAPPEDELVHARTMTLTQGPGFQLRQAAELVMTESTMRAMQELISPQRETGELRSDINRLASEFVRVTALLGGGYEPDGKYYPDSRAAHITGIE